MFTVERMVGDSYCVFVAKLYDIDEAMLIADANAYNEEPDDDFSYENYEGLGRVRDDVHDGILYWCNGEGEMGTDLTKEDKLYSAVMDHMNRW